MKNVLVITALLISTLTMAQEQKTIKIIERVYYVDENPTFEASVVISEYYANYGSDAFSGKDLTDAFEQKLTDSGIDMNKVEKDEKGYNTLHLKKNGMLYRYKTKSLNDLYKFVELKSLGNGGGYYDYIAKIDVKNEGKIVKNAVDKARKRAEAMAQNMNKKAGQLLKLETTYTGDGWKRAFGRDTVVGEIVFDVTMEFEILD